MTVISTSLGFLITTILSFTKQRAAQNAAIPAMREGRHDNPHAGRHQKNLSGPDRSFPGEAGVHAVEGSGCHLWNGSHPLGIHQPLSDFS